MFKWFSKLNIYQKLSAASIGVAILCFLVLIGVLSVRNSIDSEFGKPLVGLLDGQRESKEEVANKTVEVVLDKTEATLEIGKELQLIAKIEGAEGTNTILWDSSDEKIAKVDEKGIVTPVAVGTATIRARMNDRKSAVCVVKISEAPKPPVVEVPKPAPVIQAPAPAVVTNNSVQIMEDELLRLINQERNSRGRSSLSSVSLLTTGAKKRAVEESSASLDHLRPDGGSFSTIFDEIGYYGWSLIGENLVGGFEPSAYTAKEQFLSLAQLMFTKWKGSEGHYENMIKAEYNETGLGVNYFISNGNTYYYAVQLFAQK